MSSPIFTVFALAMLTALATGLGALPFLFVKTVSPKMRAYSAAIAGGLMLGASFGLMVEGIARGSLQALAGANLGIVFVLGAAKALGSHELEFGEFTGAGASKMLLIVLVMTVHSFSEGVAVGASFAGGIALATFTTVAIAIHNIPEGLAISAVLRPQGVSVARCAGWSVFSSLPQPLMAVPAFLFVDAFEPALPAAMGFAAGAMLLMVFRELMPDAYKDGRRPVIGALVSGTLFLMILFQSYL